MDRSPISSKPQSVVKISIFRHTWAKKKVAFWVTVSKKEPSGRHSFNLCKYIVRQCLKCSVVCKTCLFFFYITVFLIQYEDSLRHRGHWHNLTEVPGTKTTAHLKLSPYVHYNFRVLALNTVGFSRPSFASRMFKTEAAGNRLSCLHPPIVNFQFGKLARWSEPSWNNVSSG